MSLNYVKDPATQVPTLFSSGDGIDSVVQYYNNGTDEIRNLLKNECSVIYECSYCRSLFRSIINFVAHKRTICRSLQFNIQLEQLEQICDQPQATLTDNTANNISLVKKNMRSTKTLRRFNLASNLSKHIRPINVKLERAKANIEIPTLPKVIRPVAKTSFVNGKQVVEELPVGLSIKQRIPENRIALIIPTESSIRYGDMQLRSRYNANSAIKKSNIGNTSRELTPEEIAIIERIPSAIPVDFIGLRCEDERCVREGQLPFKNLAALAHHLAIQHQTNNDDGLLNKSNQIQCFLCDVAPFKELKDLQKHFSAIHSAIRKKHIQSRLEQISADASKRKEIKNFRSLSPVSTHEDAIKQVTSELKEKSKTKKPNLPDINFTPEEERKQQFAAAFALKNWIEASKKRNTIVYSPANSTMKKTTDLNNKETANTPTKSMKEISHQNTLGMLQIIDEDEARKIDKLLNSKVPVQKSEKTEATTSIETRDPDADDEPTTTSLLIQHRSPRPKRPNKKYIYGEHKIYNDAHEKSNKNCDKSYAHTSNTERKRKQVSSEECRVKIPKRKRMQLSRLTTHRKKMIITPSNVVTPTGIKDFILPESIKNANEVQETETHKSRKNSTDDYMDESTSQMCSTPLNTVEQESDSALLAKEKLPSVIADRYKEELVLYTPKARRIMEEQKRFSSSESSRRKQNLNETSEEGSSISILGSGTSQKETMILPRTHVSLPPPKPKDLAQIPVYLTESQRDLFFKPIKTLFNQNVTNDGLCQCGECGEVLKSLKDGRRHMVSHIRVIRVRCSLCDVGAFFCSDMRIHLMYRHCDKLNLAPEEFISAGVPCMDKEKADMLTQLVDPYNPGRIMYTTGKIVSWNKPKAYYPDPKIERNILGPVLPGYVPSPNTSPKKNRSSILTPKKVIHVQQYPKEEQPNTSSAADKTSTSVEKHGNMAESTMHMTSIADIIIRATNVDHDYQTNVASQEQEQIKNDEASTKSVSNSADLE